MVHLTTFPVPTDI